MFNLHMSVFYNVCVCVCVCVCVLQVTLKESSVSQRSLESQLMSSKTVDSGRDFKMKELEGRLRALEHENDMLRHKV